MFGTVVRADVMPGWVRHTVRVLCAVATAVLPPSTHGQWGRTPFPDLPAFGQDDIALVHFQRDGKRLHAGGLHDDGASRALALVRSNADGTVDASFGNGGLVVLTTWGVFEWASAAVEDELGRILVIGNAWDPSREMDCDAYFVHCFVYNVVFRVHGTGEPDLSFGTAGRVVLKQERRAGPNGEWRALLVHDARVDPDGTIPLLHRPDPSGPARVAAHLGSDGGLDRAFVPEGHTVAEADHRVAIGLVHSRLGRYFVSADPAEINGLQRGSADGWTYYNSAFRVYTRPPDWQAVVPVCRHYGLPEAGLDAHLLSANAEECAMLTRSADWIEESPAIFHVPLPDAESGACPRGFVRVYRFYRAGTGHVLTVSEHQREALLNEGFVAEGWGPAAVAMCGG